MKWIKSRFNFRNTKMMTDAEQPRLKDGKQVIDPNTNQAIFDRLEQRIGEGGVILEVPAVGSVGYVQALAEWRKGTIVYTKNIQVEFKIDPKVVTKLKLDAGTMLITSLANEMEVPPVLDAQRILDMDADAKRLRDGKFAFSNIDGKPVEYELASVNENIIKRTDGDTTVLIISAVYKPAYQRVNMESAW